jgi:hypothetical protein
VIGVYVDVMGVAVMGVDIGVDGMGVDEMSVGVIVEVTCVMGFEWVEV